MNDIINEILKAAERLLNDQSPHEYMIFTAGTGIPDEVWLHHYKDTNILIITRDGSMWRRGERVE